MPKRNDSWGIEVGANAIKAIRLVRSGQKAELVDYDILPFKHILTTPDLNVDEAIQVNLDAFLAKHDIAHSSVVVSVPGHMAFARFAKLPPVEPKKIPDIVRFEAVQQIPFPIDQVEWDYQVFQQEDSPDVEVGIFAITKERVMTYLNNYRRVNMRVDGLTLSPLAVYNAFAYENAEETDLEGTIYLDIGTSATDVIIVEHEGIWLRTLPIGGNNFTEALVRAFKLSFPKAEKLKREAGTSKYARQIFQAMRPVFADLVQELQRSIGYYQSLNRDAELKKLVGVGSTFRLPGLQKFLKQQLQMEVVRPDGYKRIHIDGKREAEFAEHALNMATAYGLALQGLELERVSANVLPSHIIKQRMWKAKQPWIAAAAACVAAASAVAGGVYFTSTASYESQAEATQPQIDRVVQQANTYSRQWQEIAGGSDPRLRIENLRRILDYRDLWPKLIEDITLAAQSVNPQEATLQADYAALNQIPRAEWRRVFIESVSAQYVPMVAPPAAASGTGAMANPRGQTSPLADRLGKKFTADEFFKAGPEGEPVAAPRFEITVTGTTPYARGAQFLSQHFVRWLQQHAERNDRPYRIVVEPTEVLSMARVGTTDANRNDGRMRAPMPGFNPAPAPTRRTTPGRFGRVPGAGEPADPFGLPGMEMMPGMEGVRGGRAVSTENLLPQRPDSTLPQPDDWRFEIRWTVELVRPERARQAEDADPTQAPPSFQEPGEEVVPEVQPLEPAEPQQDEAAAPDQARRPDDAAPGQAQPADDQEARS